MKKAFKVGDHVRSQTPQDETGGRVVRIIAKDRHIDGHAIKVSPEDLRFKVESEKVASMPPIVGSA